MKTFVIPARRRLLHVLLALLTGVAWAACGGPGRSDLPPVYVSFYSHNEESVFWENLVGDGEAYGLYRQDLIARVSLLRERGATLNWGSDHAVLRAMAAHEKGSVLHDTGDRNVLAWMVEDMGVKVDPHGHLTTYNYADLAHLIRALGVEPTGVVGGLALYQCGEQEGEVAQQDWLELLEIGPDGTIKGRVFPDASWQPAILAQAAMAGHGLDEYSSGVWRPGGNGDFLTHDENGSLISLGQGYPHDGNNVSDTLGSKTIWYEDAGYVRELADKISAGEVAADGFYTAAILLRDMPDVGDLVTIEGLADTLDALADLVDSGRVVYLDHEAVVDLWAKEYGGRPFRLGLEGFSVWDDLWSEFLGLCWPTGEDCGPDTCPKGEVCEPVKERCVPDCRIPGNDCPGALPQCNKETGLCTEESGTAVSTRDLDVTNPASGEAWWVRAYFPEDASPQNPYPAVILVPGGSGTGSSMEQGAQASGNPFQLADHGFVIVAFDADGRGFTGGVEDYCGHAHQDGLRQVVLATAALPFVEPQRIGISTSSFGITMGSGVLARYPDLPVSFLMDYEGPADRTDTGGCDADGTGHIDHDCQDDAWWSQHEAATFIQSVAVPYLRIQKSEDHVQPDNNHAILMINNATHSGHGGLGVSSWTRVNGTLMNDVNVTYTEQAPPAWYGPGENWNTTGFWAELFALDR